jgi:parallel beta-helix repeat protein
MFVDITASPFHASADGTHDDTKALETAFQAIEKNGGGTVQLPEDALVCISKSINLPSNVKITAVSGKARIKYYNASNEATKQFFLGIDVANISFSNIVFDAQHQSPTVAAVLINSYGKEAIGNTGITFENCEFKGVNAKGACAIRIQKTKDIHIEKCLFDDSYIGIGLWKRNSNINIHNNRFLETMTNNAIRLSGGTNAKVPEFCDHVNIVRNAVKVMAKKSVIGSNGKPKGRPDSMSGIYLTCGDKDYTGKSNFHTNVTIAHNYVEGARLGFFSGGSADLIAVKDVKHFQCNHNTAIGSGDLGFAFERCHHGEVNHNTAEENNSCGIAVWGSSDIKLQYNRCGSNEQTRDGIYQNRPYGGIRIEYASTDITLENNEFYHKESLPTQTQQYGIVIKHTLKKGKKLYPSRITVLQNKSIDQLFGAIFVEDAIKDSRIFWETN